MGDEKMLHPTEGRNDDFRVLVFEINDKRMDKWVDKATGGQVPHMTAQTKGGVRIVAYFIQKDDVDAVFIALGAQSFRSVEPCPFVRSGGRHIGVFHSPECAISEGVREAWVTTAVPGGPMAKLMLPPCESLHAFSYDILTRQWLDEMV